MTPIEVLVALTPNDPDAAPFLRIWESDPTLQERVSLRFAAGAALEEAIGAAEIVCCGNIAPEITPLADKLRWISFWSAGVDGKITPWMLEKKLLLTTASGVHGANMAEHVMAWMLMFERRMELHFRAQLKKAWRLEPRSMTPGELTGKTLGIVGMGRIGEALTLRARAFGMRIVATKRNPNQRYDPAVAPDALYSSAELPRLLAESDHVCIAVPYAPETHHLINAQNLALMKPTAYLHNVARGKVIEEAALIRALQNNAIAGAGLDVFEEEPLPEHSPLWSLENVLLTPHSAGGTPYYYQRTAERFWENVHRYLRKERLENLYEAERGY